jgi:hypothetical protein
MKRKSASDKTRTQAKPKTSGSKIERDDAIAAMGSDVSEPKSTPIKASEEDDAFAEGKLKLEAQRRAQIQNDSLEQDRQERKRYANHAYGITQAWIGFLIVVTILQMALRPFGITLETPEYITFVTTTTASVFGFWLLVGNYLFRKPKD